MKTHIISGAGTGIGKSIAIELSKEPNNHLVLVGRNEKRLKETASELAENTEYDLVACSVTNAEELQSAFQEIKLKDRSVSSVIANAGVGGENHYGSEDRWDEIINTNVKGVYILGNETLPYLKDSSLEEYKNVLIISSIVAHIGVPLHSAYCTSKAAVLGLMRSWAAEWSSDKILVNAICPGWVETEMAKNGIAGIAKQMDISYEEALEQQMNFLPLKKMSQPKEIAALAKFFVSGAQTSITGEEIQINNGAIMH